MLSSMTLAEIQAKYSGIHTPKEIDQFHQNMTNSKKWKIVKNEWTWDGLNHVQLRGRALQYHPNLDMVELYKEHHHELIPLQRSPSAALHQNTVSITVGLTVSRHTNSAL